MRGSGWIGVVTCLLLAAASQASTIDYSFETLDNPADLTFNQLLGINNSSVIAGYFGVGSSTHPNKGYTLVPPSTYANENFPGSTQTQVVGINNNASPITVGFWIDGSGNNFGFVEQGGTFTTVSDPNAATGQTVTQLLGVNDNNIAAGFYLDMNGYAQAFTYSIAGNSFTPVTLPSSYNAVQTTATGINNAGVVSGFYTDSSGNTHGFIDDHGSFMSFDDPSANGNTMFLGLNNDGLVVGSYLDASGITNGLVYNLLSNSWQTVDDPLGSSVSAFDVTGTTINGINDMGELVGFYSDGNDVNGLLAAVPEPGSFGLCLAAAVLLAWKTKRRKAKAG